MAKSGTSKIEFCPPAKWAYNVVEQFEQEFAKKIGVKYCVAVNSGYTALYLALKAAGIRQGDEVIVPDFTMIATANAVLACGATPIFANADYTNGNLEISTLERFVTKKTKAILPVHIYGHPCDMDSVNRIALKYGLLVFEDAAEAHGARYKGRNVGTLGDAACFSFYANKIISTGEGGCVVTNDKPLADHIRKLRSYCFRNGYWHDGVGFSFRMNPYGAEQGLRQLKAWSKLITKRRKIAKFYNQHLTDKVEKPSERKGVTSVYWMYGIRTERARALKKYLADHGIATRDFFVPMSWQPIWDCPPSGSPASGELHRKGVLLPTMPELTEKELKRIADQVNKFFAGRNERR